MFDRIHSYLAPDTGTELPSLPDAEPSQTSEPSTTESVSPGKHSRSRWVPLLCLLPAVALIGGTGYYLTRPSTETTATNAVSHAITTGASSDGVLTEAETFVIPGTPASQTVALRGRLQAAGQVIGQAPVSGQVARVLVSPGRQVNVGDRIIELSTGPTTRPASGAERQQTAAEAAQVAAVQRQKALETKMKNAQARFREAQLRVDAANRRLAESRELLARIRRGETVSLPGATPRREKKSAKSPRSTSSAQRDATAERQNAMQAALAAQRTAEQAQTKAKNGFYAASAAENQARLAKTKLDEAQTTTRQVQHKFAANEAKASDVDAARADQAEAEANWKEATAKSTQARQEANRLQIAADKADEESQQAAQRAAQALQKLQVFAKNEAPVETPAAETSTQTATLEAVARRIRSAITESEAAAKTAARLKVEADSYTRQVASTQQRLEATAKSLAEAQQKVLDTTIQANLEQVRAPASGTVLSIANVAQEVSRGEALVTIGHPERMEVTFQDTTGLWRHLKKGMLLQAGILRPATSPETATNTVGAPPSATKVPGTAVPTATPTAPQSTLMPGVKAGETVQMVQIRLNEIEPPPVPRPARRSAEGKKPTAAPTQPATLQGVVILNSNKTDRTSSFRARPGMGVLCWLPKPGQGSGITIPADAIALDEKGQARVAVLVPDSDEEAGKKPTDSSPEQAQRVEWRAVHLGAAEGEQRRVTAGLLPGERIARGAVSLQRWARTTNKNTIELVTS
jgi:biotin carboxyl carrier protein